MTVVFDCKLPIMELPEHEVGEEQDGADRCGLYGVVESGWYEEMKFYN